MINILVLRDIKLLVKVCIIYSPLGLEGSLAVERPSTNPAPGCLQKKVPYVLSIWGSRGYCLSFRPISREPIYLGC